MNTQRLVTFGCSFTANGNIPSWSNLVADTLGLEHLNYAFPASSNHVQQNKFIQHTLNNKSLPDDILIWQISSGTRCFRTLLPNYGTQEDFDNCSIMPQQFNNLFDNSIHTELMSKYTGPLWNTCDVHPLINEPHLLETLLFYFIAAKMLNPKLLIVFGWDTVFELHHIQILKQQLNRWNIEYIDDSISSHSLNQNIPLLECQHPSAEGYYSFATKLVIPKLIELQWIRSTHLQET